LDYLKKLNRTRSNPTVKLIRSLVFVIFIGAHRRPGTMAHILPGIQCYLLLP